MPVSTALPQLPDDLMRALEFACPGVAADLSARWSEPVTAYARHLFRPVEQPVSDIAVQALSTLRGVLEQRLAATPIDQRQSVLQAFDRHAVIQAGLHSQLLLDPISFNAFLLGWLGAREHDLPGFFVFAGSTVTMETTGKEGPGWLDLGSEQINLFGMGRHKLCRQSVCGAGPVSLNGDAFTKASGASMGVLRQAAGRSWGNAADAFAEINSELVAAWDRARTSSPIFFDDRHAALVMAGHLESDSSLVAKLLTDPARREMLERSIEALSYGPMAKFLPVSTDHFYGVRNKRVRKLIVDGGHLREVDRPQGISVPLERAALRDALLSGILLPNLFFLFVIISILPRVRVLGGFRQIGYVPVIQQILRDNLDLADAAERDLADELALTQNAWGMRVIEQSETVFDMEAAFAPGDVLEGLRQRYGRASLAEMTDGLKLIYGANRWRRLMRHLAPPDQRGRYVLS